MSPPPRLRVIGAGRAGSALATALSRAGWQVVGLLGRSDAIAAAASGCDLLVIATPDGAIESVAAAVDPGPAVVAHLAGSLGLEVLAPHARRAAIHPLVSLPDAELGAARLSGAWFAVAGEPIAQRVAADLGGRWFEVADADRVAYHAAAVVASNHLVALMGQVERIAGSVGAPGEAYVALAVGALSNVAAVGPAAALTGPVARGDWATVRRHVAALDPTERAAYLAMAAEARRLVDDDGLPADLREEPGA